MVRLSKQKRKLKLARQASVAKRQARTSSSVIAQQSDVLESSEPEYESSDEVYYLCSDLDDCDSAEEMTTAADNFLLWKKGAEYRKFRSVYFGDSETTRWRRLQNQKRREADAKACQKITEWAVQTQSPNDNASVVHEESSISSDDELQPSLTLKQALEKIQQYTDVRVGKSHEGRSISNYEFLRYCALERYLTGILQNPRRKVQSSLASAQLTFPKRNQQHWARKIRTWADYFLRNSELSIHRQGKHIKVKSLIDDEDIRRRCLEYLRSQPNESITAQSFRLWICQHLHQAVGLVRPVEISESTALRWLIRLGMSFSEYRPGTYVDGHEREDIVAYRNDFLLRMAEYEKRMVKFSGEDMEIEEPPELSGIKRIVLVTHDESVFSSHDGRRTMWTFEAHKPLRPKGQGRSLMVSEFMCECHGPLRLPPSMDPTCGGDNPMESLVILKPGKNADGYWKNADLVEQLSKKVIPIFEILHPHAIGLFIFDNSQNHHALPPDALRASTLNLNDGGKNAKYQRDGWFLQNGVKTRHSMVNSQGLPKGAKTILQERGLWDSTVGLEGARALLNEQPDFMEQKEWLEEVVTSHGHMIDFYPKFHPEFNFIEMYWGHAKAHCRRNCDYTFPGLQRILPEALKVPLESIKRFARKCFRYMDAYRVSNSDGSNLTSKQIEYAVKKYKSHRSIPVRILNAM